MSPNQPAAARLSRAGLARLAHDETKLAASAGAELRAKLTARAATDDELRPAYLELRRAVARVAPFIRARASLARETVLGPPRSMVESGGALLALDGALEEDNPSEALEQATLLERGLALGAMEIERAGLPAELGATALSDCAYELGAKLLESNADVPARSDAVLADARGTLEAVLLGAAALARELDGADAELARVEAAAAPLKRALDGAKTSLDWVDRGALALATGRLGAAVRRLALAGGVVTRLPYPARVPIAAQSADEPVSVLTLPAPRPSPSGSTSAEDRRALVELGRKLFTDRRLSRNNVRSCASCHDPKQWFTDGVVAQGSLNPAVPAPRHTPTLLYAPIHAAQLWDGRILTAEAQALAVIHNPAEMGLAPGELAAKLEGVPEYRGALTDADGAISLARVADALAAFEVEALVPADAPIDELARGDEKALTEDQRRGLDVFAGKGRCARCHVPPLFGGSRPRDFAVPVFAVLGVPDSPDSKTLDPDRGRGATTQLTADQHSFKTPTMRNIGKTAPYFHHGRYARLEDVIDFYDKGGGKGLELDVPNQDPDVVKLELTKEETRVLLVFLREAMLDKTPPEAAMKPR